MRAAGALVLALAVTACSGDHGLSTEAIQQDIFIPRCGSGACHGGDPPAGDLDLVSADVDARLVGVPAGQCGGQIRVVAGDPDASYLYHKLTDATPACGEHMPLGGNLSQADKDRVRDWILGLSASAGPDGGPDASLSCGGSLTACGGECVDTSSDARHCGDCTTVCDFACSASQCVTSCPLPTENCGGSCVDTTSDPAHCSDCATSCDPGQVCEASTCQCGAPVSFAGDVQHIFDQNCALAGCHTGLMPQAKLDLSLGMSYAALVGVKSSQCAGKIRVVAGDAGQSYLVNKLTGSGMCAGSQMPKGKAPLSAADLAIIYSWICNGANND